jgi:GTPase SAR1 family protein
MRQTTDREYDSLMAYFANLPHLTFDRVAGEARGLPFCKPFLDVPQAVRQKIINDMNSHVSSISSMKRKRRYDLLDDLPPGQPSGMMSMGVLLEAIDKASGKLAYGRTKMDEWKRRLVFQRDRAAQQKTNSAWDLQRSSDERWHKNDPINASEGISNSWFLDQLLPEFDQTMPDAVVVRGMAGSGKSTILKYLILNNYETLKARNVVFSRFEMMKFWTRIKSSSKELFKDESRRYMALIHARDLLLHRFCHCSKAGSFVVSQSELAVRPVLRAVGDSNTDKAPPVAEEGETEFSRELDAFLAQYATEFKRYKGTSPDETELYEIRQAASVLATPGVDLLDTLDQLHDDQLHLVIFVLAKGKTLITIYDGIDAVRPEDILTRTEGGRELWEAACKVMRHYGTLGDYRSIFGRTPRLRRRSILVVRNNTLTELNRINQRWANDIVDLPAYDVSPIPVMPAAISAATTIISYIPEFRSDITNKVDHTHLASQLLRPFERTMKHIFQSIDEGHPDDQLKDLFDGNLRKLFRLIALTLEWTNKEMLAGRELDPEDFQVSTEQLLARMASQRGLDFLSRKSYRVVETLLVGGAGWFENAIALQPMQERASTEIITQMQSNKAHHGVLDNVLNYHSQEAPTSIDDHMFVEKIRYLQILRQGQVWDEIPQLISGNLGYRRDEEAQWDKLLFLMKTGFVVVDTDNFDGRFRFRTSERGKLALALLSNLGYVENVFHQTLFPKVMVEHLSDLRRSDTGNVRWAAHSVRNAFIFLTYFKCVEENQLSGKAVPQAFRLFNKIHQGLLREIQLMTSPNAESTAEPSASKSEIASLALAEISTLLDIWRKQRIIPQDYHRVPVAPA